ncbi:hypothetical protein ACK36G_18895 [Aeromonas veronii]
MSDNPQRLQGGDDEGGTVVDAGRRELDDATDGQLDLSAGEGLPTVQQFLDLAHVFGPESRRFEAVGTLPGISSHVDPGSLYGGSNASCVVRQAGEVPGGLELAVCGTDEALAGFDELDLDGAPGDAVSIKEGLHAMQKLGYVDSFLERQEALTHLYRALFGKGAFFAPLGRRGKADYLALAVIPGRGWKGHASTTRAAS